MAGVLEEDKKDNDKDSFYDNLKDLHYKDSWLHNTVELAALGAIMVGAGRMAVKGDYSEVGNGLRTTVGVMKKGFERYLKRSGNTGAKFGYDVVNRTWGNLARMNPNDAKLVQIAPGSPMANSIINNIENDEATKKRIATEVAKRIEEENDQNRAYSKIYGGDHFKPSDNRYREIYQEVKNEEINKHLGYAPDGAPKKKKFQLFGSDPNDTKPMFNPKNMGRDLTTNGLAGLAFGAGISGFHALDRWSAKKDSQKNVDDSFALAGSFLPKEKRNGKRDDRRMKKRASLSPEMKGHLKEVGRKFPEAIMGGLGYTAVALGTQKVMGNHAPKVGSGAGAIPPSAQNLDNHDKNEHGGPKVIIELPKLTNHQMKSFQGGLATLASNGGNEPHGKKKSVH